MNTKLLSRKTFNSTQIFSLFIKIFLLLLFLFARTFTGINIFGFRLGEYLIGGSLILLILHVLLIPLFKRKYILDDKNLNIVISILIIIIAVICSYLYTVKIRPIINDLNKLNKWFEDFSYKDKEKVFFDNYTDFLGKINFPVFSIGVFTLLK